MTVHELRLEDFRCYIRRDFVFSPSCNILHGPNGTGKTTVLEALGWFSTGRSFRRSKEADMVRFGCESASIGLRCLSHSMEHELKARLGRDKRITANGVLLSSARQMLGIVPCVLFSPEDNLLIKDGPGERRRFLDICLSQLKPKYVRELSLYRRLYAEKAEILRNVEKKPSFMETIPEYNRAMAERGAYIAREREQFIRLLAPEARKHHGAISGGKEFLTLEYKTHALDADEVYTHMQERLPAETARKSCLIGCHKDDFGIILDGKMIKDFGSQGQTRTAAISLKLAQRDVFSAVLGEEPVLLLDDVLSELDSCRKDYILNHLQGGQVFITCCEPFEIGKGEALCIST